MTQNDKNLCPLGSISQEPYIMTVTYVPHDKMISPSGLFFSVFQNFDFPKFCLSHSISQDIYAWLWFLVHMCKMMMISLSFFFKFWFFGFLGLKGKRAKKWPKIINFSQSWSIFQELQIRSQGFIQAILMSSTMLHGKWHKKLNYNYISITSYNWILKLNPHIMSYHIYIVFVFA